MHRSKCMHGTRGRVLGMCETAKTFHREHFRKLAAWPLTVDHGVYAVNEVGQ